MLVMQANVSCNDSDEPSPFMKSARRWQHWAQSLSLTVSDSAKPACFCCRYSNKEHSTVRSGAALSLSASLSAFSSVFAHCFLACCPFLSVFERYLLAWRHESAKVWQDTHARTHTLPITRCNVPLICVLHYCSWCSHKRMIYHRWCMSMSMFSNKLNTQTFNWEKQIMPCQ